MRRSPIRRQLELLEEPSPGPSLPHEQRSEITGLIATLLIGIVRPNATTEASDEQDHR